mgnify:CR=1 FL=1
MYEQFDTLEEVNNRISERCFVDFKINEELSRNINKYSNGNKKYILNTTPLTKPPYPNNNCKEFKTLEEVNSIISTGPAWYELHMKNTGTFILLWGTHRAFTDISDVICACPGPGSH